MAAALGAITTVGFTASIADASSVACQSSGLLPLNVGQGGNELHAVSVVSARDVVAVGDYLQVDRSSRTLIEHWNGYAWSVQASPSRGSSQLMGVAATSSRNAWAVGYDSAGTLIEHWNGAAWRVQSSPRVRGGQLLSVAATSSRNAWAVGAENSGAVIEHWDGRSWKIQARIKRAALLSVAATSSRNAWAVGAEDSGAVIEHWNGTKWTVQLRLNPPEPNYAVLSGVAATSPARALAVGATLFPITPGADVPTGLVERSNGRIWRKQHTHFAGTALSGVSAGSPADVWAIASLGYTIDTVIEHWDGKRWTAQPNAFPGSSSGMVMFEGVSVRRSTDSWVVGSYYNAAAHQRQALALRCSA